MQHLNNQFRSNLRYITSFILLLVLCLCNRSSAQSAPDMVVTGASNHVIYVNQSKSISLDAVVNNPPTTNQECTITGPEWTWTATYTGTSSGSLPASGNESGTITASFSTAGTYNVSVAVNAKYTSSCTSPVNVPGSASFTIHVVQVNITNPSGDPTQSAQAREGINEFTFSGASPGVLNINCQASITPDNAETQAWATTNVSWTVDAIGGSAMTFVGGNDKGLNVTCRFTGLPAASGDFGAKTVTMTIGTTTQTRTIEVFYSKDSTNHPGGDQTRAGRNSTRSPNWFYYWNPTVGDTDAFFDSTIGEFGVCPAMYHWQSILPYSKTEIWIGSTAASSDSRRDGSGQVVTGIDLFANVVRHENHHVTQIAQADALLGAQNNKPFTIWRSGWSWNTGVHNHWTLGADGKTGVGGVDDDGNGHTDDALEYGELGAAGSDDVGLDLDNNDVPDAWQPYDIEDAAGLQETVAEHTNWLSDWGNFGKRHATNQVYSD